MTDITFTVSESEYDKKLLLQFEYDTSIVGKIKSLSWDATHYGFHDPDDTDSELHGFVDESTWFVDYDTDTLSRVKETLDVTIPHDIWPDDSEESPESEGIDSVTVTADPSRGTFSISPLPDSVAQRLDTAFAYDVDGAEHSTAYQNGNWDGKHHLFDSQDGTAPIGLLDRAVSILDEEDVTTDVSWRSKPKGDVIETEWGFDHALREYQRESVRNVIANDGGIISLPTGTGKTITALRAMYELNRRTLVLVHTKELVSQWADEIRDVLNTSVGTIADGDWSEGPVTVATIQSLMSRGVDSLAENYGICVFDECHRTSAADKMHEIGLDLNVFYRIGLSATPWRRVDGAELKIEGAVKGVAHDVSAEDMIANGYLANPVFEAIDPNDFGSPTRADQYADYDKAYRECIELDPTRITAIAETAVQLADNGHKVLVNVDRVIQGELIAWMLNPAVDVSRVRDHIAADDDHRERLFDAAMNELSPVGRTNALMVSSNTTRRESIIREFETGDRDIIVSTLLKEGVDIPDITAVILAHGMKSSIETIQTIGRALRPTENFARIVDVADSGRFFRDAFETRMNTITQYYNIDTELSLSSMPVPAVETSATDGIESLVPQRDKQPQQRTLQSL